MTIINKKSKNTMNSLGRAQKSTNIAGVINARLKFQATQVKLNRELGLYNLDSTNHINFKLLAEFLQWPPEKQRHFKVTIGGATNEWHTTRYINQLLRDYKIIEEKAEKVV